MPFARRSRTSAAATASTGRRRTRWSASPATCASTRWSTPRTGSSAASSPSRSSKEELMATEAQAVAADDRSHGTLRRELRFWEAIAISVGIMAPTAAMALNGVVPASLVGRAVPLAFLFAAIAIGLISYSFVRLTTFFNHAGSTYALAGATLGPRSGFFAGWVLLATYSCFIAANIAEIGLFGTSFLDGAGIWNNPSWILVSLIAALLVWFLAYGDVKVATRALLSFEG